jgi:hypothetical protein
MNSTIVGLITVTCVFGGALLGVALQKALPRHHLSKESHEIVKLGAGMIATLTALVLGLLVSSAKNTFDTLSEGIVQAGAKVILLDRTLAAYGPEAKALRDQLRRTVAVRMENLWPGEGRQMQDAAAYERAKGLELIDAALRELAPKNDAQRQLLAQARQLTADLAQTRWLLIEQAQTEPPVPFIVVLLFWLTMLFTTFGLFAPRNGTVLTVLFVCACSVSAAVFLILELNRPLTGLIKVSNAPLLKALEHLGR